MLFLPLACVASCQCRRHTLPVLLTMHFQILKRRLTWPARNVGIARAAAKYAPAHVAPWQPCPVCRRPATPVGIPHDGRGTPARAAAVGPCHRSEPAACAVHRAVAGDVHVPVGGAARARCLPLVGGVGRSHSKKSAIFPSKCQITPWLGVSHAFSQVPLPPPLRVRHCP